MRARQWWWLPVLSLAVVGGVGTRARAADDVARIELYAEVEATGLELDLGTLARVDAVSPEGRQSLERIPICYAPVPGSQRQISRDYIRLKLRQQRVDLSRVELAGAEVVHVVSTTSTIPAETIVRTVTDAILEAMPWPRDETEILPPRVVPDVVVAAADPVLDVEFAPDESFLGSTLAYLHVYAGDTIVHSQAFRFHVGVYHEVYQARAYIPRGGIVGPEQVTTARADIAQLSDRYIADRDAVLGRRATRSIRPGTRLTPDMLERPPVVSRGDRVRVSVEGDQFEISLRGEAREPGALGSVIRVDLPNKQRVYARVSAPGHVVLTQ